MCVFDAYDIFASIFVCYLCLGSTYGGYTHTRTGVHVQDVGSNRYPIAASCGRVLLHLSVLPGKGRASSDAIATNGCIKRFSVPTILPTPRWAT